MDLTDVAPRGEPQTAKSRQSAWGVKTARSHEGLTGTMIYPGVAHIWRTQTSQHQQKEKHAHYFTKAKIIGELRDLDKEANPFLGPTDLEMFAHKVLNKAWRDEAKRVHKAVKCQDKGNYFTKQKKDVLQRLYIEEPTTTSMKTRLGDNPEYYSVIQGRPIPDNLNVKEYVGTIRNILLTRLLTGYREDDIMVIDEQLTLEQLRIDEINVCYQTYVNTFEDFLYRDHTESMELLKKSEDEARMAQQRRTEYFQLAKEYSALRSAVYKLEDRWLHCKLYQKFVHMISPTRWMHERSFNVSTCVITSTSLTKCKLKSVAKTESLPELIKAFNDDCDSMAKAEVYFQTPDQLMDVFKALEMQNLTALLHAEEFVAPLLVAKDSILKIEEAYNNEIARLQAETDQLEGGISREEDRAEFLDKVIHKLITEVFKPLIVEDLRISLYVLVEDAYETRIGPNDANLSMVNMMTALEQKYRDEALQVDIMPIDQISALEGTFYKQKIYKMQLAEKAMKQHDEIQRIRKKMLQAMEPPFVKQGKELKQRSVPPHPMHSVMKPPRELTAEEQDYLNFFTTYCPYSDKLIDFGINIRDGRTGTVTDEVNLTSWSKHVIQTMTGYLIE